MSSPYSDAGIVGWPDDTLEAARPWTARLPLLFLISALLALLVGPVLVMRWIRAFPPEIRLAAGSPCLLVRELQLTHPPEPADPADFHTAPEPGFRRAYRTLVAAEGNAFSWLKPGGGDVDPGAGRRFRAAAGPAAHRRAMFHAEAVDERLALAELHPRSFEPLPRDEASRLAAGALALARIEQTEAQRDALPGNDPAGRGLVIPLLVFALASVGVVAGLVWRLRAVTRESDRRRRELEQALESKARVVRGISHDLKNPLGAIDGYAHLLESGLGGELAPDQLEWIGGIRQSVRTGLEVLEGALELVRAETGKLGILPQAIDIALVAVEAVDDCRAAAAAAGITLEAERARDELPAAQADPSRVRQILGHLLLNAVRYTPEGGRVAVRTGLRTGGKAPRSGRWIVVDVVDDGPGIPHDQQEKIFEEFHRFAPASGKQPGLGLGLPLSRRIARLLGGDVTVESEPGLGSTFTLWLPASAVPLHTPQQET